MKKGALLFTRKSSRFSVPRKSLIFVGLIALLIMPVAFADIQIQTEQNIYNLGNRIKASASVLQSNNFEGLFKLALSCGNYNLQYFLTPISLEANFRTAVNVPEIVANSQMKGNCTITGNLLTNDNVAVEEADSNSFYVTSSLAVLPVKKEATAFPGDSILVSGVVNEAFGSNVLKSAVKISLDNSTYATDAIDGKFNITIDIAARIKSGKHTIAIEASDSKGNFGSSSIALGITAVPSYIKNELSAESLEPGSSVGITSSLYDQADDLIDVPLNLELASPGKSRVFRKVVQSNEKISYEFSQYAEPGAYMLTSAYESLKAESPINVSTIREVKVKYENETVFVENTGNVPFEDELTFILESAAKKIPITKKISIEPAKILSIDLSKEVPLGIYDIMVPVREGLEPVRKMLNENLTPPTAAGSPQQENAENVLASEVTIHDNRPVYRRIAGGLSSISSAIVGADGVLAKNPLIAPIVLVVIVAVLVFRYGRKPIMRLIRGKKNDE